MKKITLTLVLAVMLLFVSCDIKQAPANSTDDSATGTVTPSTPTENAEEPELYSFWESTYEQIMAEWQPAQRFNTDEYTYGIDELSISQNDDGTYTVAFVFGTAFNLYIGDYYLDEARVKLSGQYYPALFLDKEAEQQLVLQEWSPIGSETMNAIIGPYLAHYEYVCNEKPQALYFKTPEHRILDMHAELVVDDPSLYTIEYGEPYTYDAENYTPVKFVLDESLGWIWTQAKLTVNDTEYEANFGRRDGIDYFDFELPEGVDLDSGYTFTLCCKYVDIQRQVFEIDLSDASA